MVCFLNHIVSILHERELICGAVYYPLFTLQGDCLTCILVYNILWLYSTLFSWDSLQTKLLQTVKLKWKSKLDYSVDTKILKRNTCNKYSDTYFKYLDTYSKFSKKNWNHFFLLQFDAVLLLWGLLSRLDMNLLTLVQTLKNTCVLLTNTLLW